MYFFIEFVIFLKSNLGETGQHVLEPYKDNKLVLSNDEGKIIFRKNKDRKYMREDFIELKQVGENLKSSSFRLKFTDGDKYLCVKKLGDKNVSLCNSADKPITLTWEIEDGPNFKKLKINNKCLAKVGGLFTKLALRIQKCRNTKIQKWNLIPQNVPSEEAPSKENKKVEKADEESSSDNKNEEDPQIVPDSVIKQMENPETRDKNLDENAQILRNKLEHIAPMFVHKTEESSSDDAHLIRKPSATDKSEKVLPDDIARWQLDQKLNFEYHPPNKNKPEGEIVQIFPKTPLKRANSLSRPILSNSKNPITYIDVESPKTPEEKGKAADEQAAAAEPNSVNIAKNKIPVEKKKPPKTGRKGVPDNVLRKILKKVEKKKRKPEFSPTSPLPYRNNSLGNGQKKFYKIPESFDFEKTDFQMDPDQANPSKVEKLEGKKESKKNWLDKLIDNIKDKKKKADNYLGHTS